MVHAQAGVTQTFIVHGTPKTCTAITQLDSALASDSQQFFAGWTEKDYSDAFAWSQACADYGWHVPGHPRLPMLQAQHDRALGAAQPQVAETPTAAPVGAAAGPVPVEVPAAGDGSAAVVAGSAGPEPPAPDAAAAGAGPTPPESVAPPRGAETMVSATPPVPGTAAAQGAPGVAPAEESLQPQMLTTAPPGTALPVAPAEVTPPMQTQMPADAAVVSPLPSSRTRDRPTADDADGLLTEEFFKKHFHQESLWVARKAGLDLGDNRDAVSWPTSGSSAQMKSRLTADRIVLYCARKTNGGKAEGRPLLWDLRWCESEEASAYSRLVSGGEFPSAGRDVVLGCAGEDSYVYLERCVQTLVEGGRR
jgi:hypothetical protein